VLESCGKPSQIVGVRAPTEHPEIHIVVGCAEPNGRRGRHPLTLDGRARLAADFPLRTDRVMPTRLGNILRAAEDHAYERYAINAVVVWPRLYVVLPDRFVAARPAARTPLDLMAAVGLLAATFTVARPTTALITLPLPAALPCLAGGLAPTLAGLQRRRTQRRPYGQLVRAAFDVHRTLLLDQMNLSRSRSYAAERQQWEQISRLWYQGAPDVADGARLLGYTTEPAQRPTSDTVVTRGWQPAGNMNVTRVANEGPNRMAARRRLMEVSLRHR